MSTVREGINRIAVTVKAMPGALLVIHAFAEKAKQEIRDKQGKKAKKAKEMRDPNAEFLAARYLNEQGLECAPVTAIKKSIITAATAFDGLTKVALRQAVFVAPEDDPASAYLPIETLKGKPSIGVMREDAVTIGINTRGLTYRPEYKDWQLRFTIDFNARMVSEEQLRALVDQAGWGVGICEGRPERSSALGWGRYEISRWEQA